MEDTFPAGWLGALHEYLYYYTLFLLRGKVCLQSRCSKGCKSYPLLDSPDPSKTQQTVGTVLVFITPPASRGQSFK